LKINVDILTLTNIIPDGMKKITFALLFVSIVNLSFAQQEDRFRVGMDLGFAVPKAGGGGALVYLEPKYNFKSNMNIGLRFGLVGMARDVVYNTSNETVKGEVSGNGSFALTYDYHFHKEGSNFAPFLGVGVGRALFSNLAIEDPIGDGDDIGQLSTNSATFGMVRGGFETGKFRLSLDYNFLPVSDIVDVSNNVIGETENSYFGISLGFFVGGGRWRNSNF
jgi:hypothetical protein